jgi:hypothetical protein
MRIAKPYAFREPELVFDSFNQHIANRCLQVELGGTSCLAA